MNKKRLLIVEDDPGVMDLLEQMVEPYSDKIDVLTAENGGEALEKLLPEDEQKPNAVCLDIMMGYGTAGELLGESGDPDGNETGIQILRYLREQESVNNRTPTWVAVITARNAPDVLARLETLLAGSGRVYLKPFNDLELENDLALVLELESEVNPILLPDNYSPPIKPEGAGDETNESD